MSVENHLHAVNWFEIPVSNFERAKSFYEKIFDCEMPVHEMMGHPMAFFPCKPHEQGVGGVLIKADYLEPGDKGPLLYLNADDDLNDVLNRVADAGGEVLQEKVQVTEDIGYIAIFKDSEGNKLALHSRH